jgi:hypothetical protein
MTFGGDYSGLNVFPYFVALVHENCYAMTFGGDYSGHYVFGTLSQIPLYRGP